MVIDNQVVQLTDTTGLPNLVSIVEYRHGKGEIERYYNGARMRENFVDVTPFVPLFRQYMTLLPDITVAQAKTVQCNLMDVLFDSKRQMPFAQTVAAVGGTSRTFSAVDEAIIAMTVTFVPLLGKIVTAYADSLFAQANNRLTSIVSQANTQLTSIVSQANTQLTSILNQLNNNIIGIRLYDYGWEGEIGEPESIWHPGTQTINNLLQHNVVIAYHGGEAFPGLNSDLPHVTYATLAFTALTFTALTPNVTAIPITPTDSATPLNLSVLETITLLNGIATRRQNLHTIRVNKQSAVNALTTLPDVINYDVTAGW